MARPFIFRINAAELFAEVQSLHHKQRSSWILQLAQDLLTLKPQLSYSEKLIKETIDFMEKKREAGSKGGRPSKTKGLAEVKQTITNAKPKVKQEVEVEVEVEKNIRESVVSLPDWLPLESWNAYVEMRKKLKKPMTEYAAKLRIKDLERFKDEGHNLEAILNQSVANSWTDIYPPKAGKSEAASSQKYF